MKILESFTKLLNDQQSDILDLAADHDCTRLARLIGVSRLANITGLDLVGVPVVSAIRPAARSLCVSLGKGLDINSAVLSAVMEAAELFHAEKIKAPTQIFPISRPAGLITKLPELVQTDLIGASIDQSVRWLVGNELLKNEPIFVPFEAVDMDQGMSSLQVRNRFSATSTGLAAGFSHEFAVRHSLLETIERDAHSLWRVASTDYKLKGLINPATVDDEVCMELIEKFRSAGYSPCFWDITSDIGIPCYVSEFFAEVDGGGFFWPYSIGVGCDLLPSRALTKAILEAAQIRLTYIAGARDDLLWSDYSETYESVASSRRSLREAALPAKDFRYRNRDIHTIDHDVNQMLEAIAASGLDQIIIVDLSHEGTGFHVVKSLVPGLEDSVDAGDKDLSARGVARLAELVSAA